MLTEKTTKILGAIAAASALFFVSMAPATAGAAQSEGISRSLVLHPTASGSRVGLRGSARIDCSAADGAGRLLVKVEAPGMRAGASLQVLAVNPTVSADAVVMGSLSMERGSEMSAGELVVNESPRTLPMAAVTEIRVVSLDKSSEVLLRSTVVPFDAALANREGERSMRLVPQGVGAELDLSGSVNTRIESGAQSMSAVLKARGLAAGSKLDLFFTHSGNTQGQFFAGRAVVVEQGGELVARFSAASNSARALPLGAAGVNGISTFWITRAETGDVIAAGAF